MPDASAELRRLLVSMRDYLNDPDLQEFRWVASQVDQFIEKMLPLWADCDIESPGIYIDRRTNQPTSPNAGLSLMLIECRDPDAQIQLGIGLRQAKDGRIIDATVRELTDVGKFADRWIAWLEARNAHLGKANNSRAGGNKRGGSPAGRPPKLERTPEEIAVMDLKEQRGLTLSEIDESRETAPGYSKKINDRVTKRERNRPTKCED